ncbi:hypothetical protein TMO_a0336 (plasmid) [Tistrella mobilis KA081020-065]|uniref:Uncharacterized protein n=1 Tax=Tistrella mobilis (strain KA081020-065) TaxID=1110502 RepID=I3TSK1_TISMK|nr:hypothetical protein TMO_a0336 [Tistrella mobilis KA081020-065]
MRHCGFNPRTRKGATPIIWPPELRAWFQSTHPQGCDLAHFGSLSTASVSIHAPARVRQFDLTAEVRDQIVSIHAPARVRRQVALATRLDIAVSIHAPARVRLLSTTASIWEVLFQSTHPQGCDYHAALGAVLETVSIHAPARVRLTPS